MSALLPFRLSLLSFLLATLNPLPVSPQEQPDPVDTIQRDTRARMEKERRDSEWKKLKEDTDRLVQAANELRDMIDKSNKDTFSVAIIKKTEEVEKILKDIKRKAKDGF